MRMTELFVGVQWYWRAARPLVVIPSRRTASPIGAH